MILHKKTKRDVIFIAVIIGLIGMYFLATTFLIEPKQSTAAHVFYGNNSEPIVTIDFVNARVTIHYLQEGSSQYPFINMELNTITLLGDYEISGVRQEVVIGFNFSKQTVVILEEESPYNVCSNLGESDRQALICLPNAIRVEFTDADLDFVM